MSGQELTHLWSQRLGGIETDIGNAIENAVARADKTIRNMRWFQVDEIRGHIAEGGIAYWQVTVRIGFTLEDEEDS